MPHERYLVDPGDVNPAYASTLACSGITVYSAIKKVMPMAPNEPIVLFGAGGLGLAAIAMLKALGHTSILSIDISAEKRAVALEMGATHVFDGSRNDLAASIIAVTGAPLMAVIDFVNTGSTSEAGLELLGKGGKLCITVRYGARTLEIIEGKNAIETDNIADVITSLQVIRTAVDLGELDKRIDAVMGQVKAGIAKDSLISSRPTLKLPVKQN